MRTLPKLVLIAGLFLFAACGGSGDGGGEDRNDEAAAPAPLTCGGEASVECPGGYRCTDDPSQMCGAENGADCSGLCVLGGELTECGGFESSPCPDNFACVDDPSDDCPGGPAVDCPGFCQPRSSDQCSSDSDCVSIQAPCSECADGTVSCPVAVCENGQCAVTVKPCPRTTCGGFGGLPCAPGDECVDDPTDECDPMHGAADCDGVCIPGPKPGCGGINGATCPPDYQCVDVPGDECDPMRGADCPQVCEPTGEPECMSDQECPQLRAPCSVCADGSEACPRSYCEDARCRVEFPTCKPPLPCGGGCEPGFVCVEDSNGACDPSTGMSCGGICVRPDEPRSCGGFIGESCPSEFECVDDSGDDCFPDMGGADCPGVCQPVSPGECKTDEECPVIAIACSICADGSAACPRAVCENGKCQGYFDACSGPGFCGGIAGFPCAPGYTCVDSPNDDCDPAMGGADCGGMCVREDEPRGCGGFAGFTCPDGFECADDARDDCFPDMGGADCPGVCRAEPNPSCRSDNDCFAILAPCMICADGTAACPKSFCENGECRAEFETCGGES